TRRSVLNTCPVRQSSSISLVSSFAQPSGLRRSLFISCRRALPQLHSFPTRRSSDLLKGLKITGSLHMTIQTAMLIRTLYELGAEDRKSTRLNSSHVSSSYAVFCLKKKNISTQEGHSTLSALQQKQRSSTPTHGLSEQ